MYSYRIFTSHFHFVSKMPLDIWAFCYCYLCLIHFVSKMLLGIWAFSFNYLWLHLFLKVNLAAPSALLSICCFKVCFFASESRDHYIYSHAAKSVAGYCGTMRWIGTMLLGQPALYPGMVFSEVVAALWQITLLHLHIYYYPLVHVKKAIGLIFLKRAGDADSGRLANFLLPLHKALFLNSDPERIGLNACILTPCSIFPSQRPSSVLYLYGSPYIEHINSLLNILNS